MSSARSMPLLMRVSSHPWSSMLTLRSSSNRLVAAMISALSVQSSGCHWLMFMFYLFQQQLSVRRGVITLNVWSSRLFFFISQSLWLACASSWLSQSCASTFSPHLRLQFRNSDHGEHVALVIIISSIILVAVMLSKLSMSIVLL